MFSYDSGLGNSIVTRTYLIIIKKKLQAPPPFLSFFYINDNDWLMAFI